MGSPGVTLAFDQCVTVSVKWWEVERVGGREVGREGEEERRRDSQCVNRIVIHVPFLTVASGLLRNSLQILLDSNTVCLDLVNCVLLQSL